VLSPEQRFRKNHHHKKKKGLASIVMLTAGVAAGKDVSGNGLPELEAVVTEEPPRRQENKFDKEFEAWAEQLKQQVFAAENVGSDDQVDPSLP
jgi:hypothetical protein